MNATTVGQRVRERLRATPFWAMFAAGREHRRAAARPDGSIERIAALHRSLCPPGCAAAISDRHWADLELDRVFERADHCTSCTGQQVLYHLMRTPLFDPAAVASRDELARALAADAGLRREIAAAVAGLRRSAAYDLHHLISGDLPARPSWSTALPALSITSAAAIAIMFVNPLYGLLLLLATICVNLAIQIFYRPGVHHLIRPISALPGLLSAARRIVQLQSTALAPHIGGLREQCERLRWLSSPARHAVRDSDATSPSATLAAYLNLVFLADVNAFVFSLDMIVRHRRDIEDVMLTVGMLDALCAVAMFRESLPHWCTPRLDGTAGRLTGRSIYHPLVAEPVGNDMDLDGASMLITGSNMGGKTTYLRAAGVCAVLAQTIATCPATEWRSACLRIATLIAREDDLTHGRSYFLVEAEHVRDLLTVAAGDQPYLFILDELYRGTNTHERVAAAHAVLEQLNARSHICLVATHDTELVELLTGTWQPWHFQETWAHGEMRFDYRIRPGAASAGNALTVLEMVGYPPEVMATARATFARLRETR